MKQFLNSCIQITIFFPQQTPLMCLCVKKEKRSTSFTSLKTSSYCPPSSLTIVFLIFFAFLCFLIPTWFFFIFRLHLDSKNNPKHGHDFAFADIAIIMVFQRFKAILWITILIYIYIKKIKKNGIFFVLFSDSKVQIDSDKVSLIYTTQVINNHIYIYDIIYPVTCESVLQIIKLEITIIKVSELQIPTSIQNCKKK